jgi:hypothetical protein
MSGSAPRWTFHSLDHREVRGVPFVFRVERASADHGAETEQWRATAEVEVGCPTAGPTIRGSSAPFRSAALADAVGKVVAALRAGEFRNARPASHPLHPSQERAHDVRDRI